MTAAPLPPKLESELKNLDGKYSFEIGQEADAINVIISGFPTGPKFSAPTTTLLVRVPRAFPDAGLDMFWTDPALTLAGGGVPKNADPIEQHSGRLWRRFSWHPQSSAGAPTSFSAYLHFVATRFEAGE